MSRRELLSTLPMRGTQSAEYIVELWTHGEVERSARPDIPTDSWVTMVRYELQRNVKDGL